MFCTAIQKKCKSVKRNVHTRLTGGAVGVMCTMGCCGAGMPDRFTVIHPWPASYIYRGKIHV